MSAKWSNCIGIEINHDIVYASSTYMYVPMYIPMAIKNNLWWREIILGIDRICNLKSGLFFQHLIRNNLPSHVEQDLLSFFSKILTCFDDFANFCIAFSALHILQIIKNCKRIYKKWRKDIIQLQRWSHYTRSLPKPNFANFGPSLFTT